MNIIQKGFRVINHHIDTNLSKVKNTKHIKALRYYVKDKLYVKDSIRSHKNDNVKYSELETEIINTLNKDGIAIFDSKKLLGEEAFNSLMDYLKKFMDSKEFKNDFEKGSNTYKDYLIMKSKRSFDFPFNDPLIKIAISDPMVNIPNGYFGMRSKLNQVDLWYTMPSPKDSQRKFSQNWHRDPEDYKIIKAFLYLNDVEKESGPFSYIKGTHKEGRYKDFLKKNHAYDSIYPDDKILENGIAKEDIIECTGKAGTIIFADTNGFHRGGHGTKERILCIFIYTPPSSISKKRMKIINYDKKNLSDRVRYLIKDQPKILSN